MLKERKEASLEVSMLLKGAQLLFAEGVDEDDEDVKDDGVAYSQPQTETEFVSGFERGMETWDLENDYMDLFTDDGTTVISDVNQCNGGMNISDVNDRTSDVSVSDGDEMSTGSSDVDVSSNGDSDVDDSGVSGGTSDVSDCDDDEMTIGSSDVDGFSNGDLDADDSSVSGGTSDVSDCDDDKMFIGSSDVDASSSGDLDADNSSVSGGTSNVSNSKGGLDVHNAGVVNSERGVCKDVVDLTASDVEQEMSSVVVHCNMEVNTIDLTTSDVEEESMEAEEDVVWGGAASRRDVMEIERMLATGVGVFGSPNCVLEVKSSLLQGAGRGVFVKEGRVIKHRECITRYSGYAVRSAKHLSTEEQLRTVQVGDLLIVGNTELNVGDGFGSLLNSSVSGRTQSFCRFVFYNGAVYVMAHCPKESYPLIGPIELYIVAGHGWWSLFNSD